MFNLLTNYEFDSVMHIHKHACTPYMHNEAFTLSRLHAIHARRFQHVLNSAHVRRRAMNVYSIIHVRRTPVWRTCTPYMYDSVNIALVLGVIVVRHCVSKERSPCFIFAITLPTVNQFKYFFQKHS